MRRLCLLTLLIPLLCFTHGAKAQIHRCIGAQGEPVFTDQPCGSGELSADAASGSLARTDPANATSTAPASSGTRIAATCPRSPQQVRDRISVAFNDDDPNALAGLFDWRGFSHQSADARLKDFSRWLKHPLVGVQFSGAADPSGAQPGDADYTPSDPSGLTVLTQMPGEPAPETRSFGMVERGGCWWLSF